MKRKTVISTILILLLIAGAVSALFFSFGPMPPGAGSSPGVGSSEGVTAETSGGEAPESRATPVTLEESIRTNLVADVELNGEVEPANRVKVYPEVTGEVRRIEVSEGDKVEKDQPLLYVDPSKPGTTFQESPARSPISGVIVSIDTERGAEVRPTMPVVTIATLREMRVALEIPERYASVIERGMQAYFTPFANEKTYEGTIEKIEPTIDSATRSKEVKIGIRNGISGLTPGMFVRVSLPLERAADAVVVPFEALVQSGENTYVYTVRDNTAHRISVRTGIIAENLVQIRSGLEGGVPVIVEGHQELAQGKKVKVVRNEEGKQDGSE